MKIMTALAAGLVAATFALPASAAPLPTGCKLVELERPNVKAPRNEIIVTFSGAGADLGSIRKCNPSGGDGLTVLDVPVAGPAGTNVRLRAPGGVGKIGLPTMLAIGRAHQAVCDVDDKDAVVWRLYAIEWKELGGRIRLVDQTATMGGDAETHRKACEASRPPSRS
ncbi:MAG: hypothetical protein UY98_C0001G0030 [Candidatus Kaiserbacteria bacterium GW2011_GWA2_58_9]|uniref:Uncharacterized protein n=1 Tax=Candidatus Kaiserbacteria bacterium GW2011_GWA2_58_9 TaxID=1618672 RepID=A0A0G1YWZ0_9BACT|nr:MAG: hypothetical protein UY98_C0001G0030 [Candidatus Kaiserbacteria bacterium GW2011_GWA2_58_9]